MQNTVEDIINTIFGKNVVNENKDLFNKVFKNLEDVFGEPQDRQKKPCTKHCECGADYSKTPRNTKAVKMAIVDFEKFVDVNIDNNVYTLNICTPGYTKEDFKVVFNKKDYTMSITFADEVTSDRRNFLKKMNVVVNIPENVDVSTLKKTNNNGILTISAYLNEVKEEDFEITL